MNNSFKPKLLILLILILATALVIFVYREIDYKEINSQLNKKISELEEKINEQKSSIEILQNEKNTLEEELGQTIEDLEEKEEKLDEEAKRNKEILNLITIEDELLQKYSKVSFLNEHYAPKKVSAIDKEFWANPNKLIDVDSRIEDFIDDLLNAAKKDGVDLRVISGYRSFGTQSALKASYLVQYGSGANTFSADQGYSEHQLGTTVDFTSPEVGNDLSVGFENTKAFKWLEDNAHKYGFVLSYPKGNAYYQYEPWHWRFVSRDLAKYLYKNDKYFYDLDQREIWDYLGNFFK